MNEVEVIASEDGFYTVQNGDGDQFTFHFPTRNAADATLEGPVNWKIGHSPDEKSAAVLIDIARKIATDKARLEDVIDS